MYFGRTARICAALVPLVGTGFVGCNNKKASVTQYDNVTQFDSTTSEAFQRSFLIALDEAGLYVSGGKNSRILGLPKLTTADSIESSLDSTLKSRHGGS